MKLSFALSALLVLVVSFEKAVAEDLKLLILHNNDMHGRFEEVTKNAATCKAADKGKNCYGGFARTAHVIREARKAANESRGPPVLYLNAGDTYSGTSWFSVHKWKIVADFLNRLHPDVASFGNHEFDNKVAGIVPFLDAATFPIVAANLDFSKEPTLLATNVSKSVVLDVAGRKIGVIGFLTPETTLISTTENVIINNEVESIKAESERLDKEGVKIIIALGHSGYETDKEIAKNVPLVDLVVGGHTNTFLWNGPQPDVEEIQGPYPTIVTQSRGKKVPIVQAFAYTKYLGHLTIDFNDAGEVTKWLGQPILLNNSIPQEDEFLDLLEKYRKEVEDLDKEVVGRSRVILDGSKESCRYKECNFANFIADAYVDYHSSLYGGSYWTDAPIALINAGALRSTIVPNRTKDGSITRGELLEALPFDDQITSMTLNGTDLLKTLEIGVRSNGETSRGEFIQSSGIRYRFDLNKPVGSRVVEAKVRCSACSVPIYEPIVAHKSYRIITVGFLSDGGDGHTIIKNGQNKVNEDLSDLDIVAWYMKKSTPIYPEVDERIIARELEDEDKDKDKKKDEDMGGKASVRFASIFLIIAATFGLSLIR